MPNWEHDRGTDEALVCPLTLPSNGHAPKWYALRLKSNREFQCRAALHAAGIEQFLPTWSEDVRWSDRVRERIRPLFPGYIFARLSPAELVPVCATRGVIQILPNNFHPFPIDDAEIEIVKRLARNSAVPCDYGAGELVTIDSGPLAGVTGTVVRTRGQAHVVVSIEIFRQSVRVEIDAATLVRKEAG